MDIILLLNYYFFKYMFKTTHSKDGKGSLQLLKKQGAEAGLLNIQVKLSINNKVLQYI